MSGVLRVIANLPTLLVFVVMSPVLGLLVVWATLTGGDNDD